MRNLWPSIEVIESNLQTAIVAPLHFPDREQSAVEEHSNTANAEMPAFLRDKIRKRVSSRMAQFDTQPQAGQIWRFDGDAGKTTPLCVLLDSKQDEHRWQGWLTAAETDYASNRDVLLELQDEPFDPLAGMVQIWNPVCVDIRKGSRVLAQLANYRMAAIREVARGECETGGGARPGFIAPLKTNSGASVLSGTRIAHAEDPRRRYQSLYRSAAQSLDLNISQTQQSPNVIPLPGRQRIWRKVGWSLAASVMLAQTAIIANLLRDQQVGDLNTQIDQASEYRATPQAPANYTYLEVYFKPDAKEVDIRKLLTRLNATIAEGAGDLGQYRLRVKTGTEQAAMQVMRESGLVDSVEAL